MVRPLIVGNWKLHKTIGEALEFTQALSGKLPADVDVGVAPPFTALAEVCRAAKGTKLQVYGQNCHWEMEGAFTGEVSPTMLVDAGADGVILGHSERRTLFGESDATLGKKLKAALGAQLKVIACLGETEAERDAGHATQIVSKQLSSIIEAVSAPQLPSLTIAYEPVWAIGTGKTASPEQAQDMHAAIRERLVQKFGAQGEEVTIQYGGSVKPANAKELLSKQDINGALVGGASLRPDTFLEIVNSAQIAN